MRGGLLILKKYRKIIISIVIIIVLALVLPLPRRMKVTLKGREYPDNQAEVTAAINAVYLDWLVLKDKLYGKIYLEPYYEDVEEKAEFKFAGSAVYDVPVSDEVSFKKTALWRYNSKLNQVCFGDFGVDPHFKRFLVEDELNGKFYVFWDDAFSYEETVEYFEFFWR